ncbi:MAG: hypothetical protein ACE5K1_03325 [Acidiferrobacterales bacterium]
MSQVLYTFGASAIVAAVLAAITIWSPRALRTKLAALAVAAVFLPTIYVSLIELLSQPKPIGLEWRRIEVNEATVLSSSLDEGKAIYLWLAVPGVVEPRAYALPWDRKLAQNLHRAQQDAEGNGTPVRIKFPFAKSEADRRMFYAVPQPKRPPKAVPANTAIFYQPELRR